MSPQHDWLKSFGPGSQPGEQREPADSGVTAEPPASAEADDVEKAADQPASTEAPAEGGSSAGAGQHAGTTPGEPGHSGWSGRAVGPLSSLLPGGAVELDAGELPVEPAVAVVADHQPLLAAGATGAEPATAAAADSDEPAAVDAADGTVAGEALPAAQRDEPVDDAEEPGPGLSATDDRWHAALVGFVDDPRGSVEAARALIDEDIATHVALLARRKDAMHAAWRASEHADTEALRVTLVKYRDLRTRLADVLSALTG